MRWQLCTQHAPRWTAKLHPRIEIAHKHHSSERKQAAAQQTDRACGPRLGCAQPSNCRCCHTCEPGGSCAHSTRPAEQLSCTHASKLRIGTVAPLKNKPRQSTQLVRAARVSVVLDSAIASATAAALWRHSCDQSMRPAEQRSRMRKITRTVSARHCSRASLGSRQ